jgi:GTPase SAR1 family protein
MMSVATLPDPLENRSSPVATPGMDAAVRGVLRDAIDAYADEDRVAQSLRRHMERLDEPLRVAIAGKVKAGKSTLLNALVGEEIAPTDAGECTRVVTWYQYASSPRITLEPKTGVPTQLPLHRADGRLSMNLAGHSAHEVERLLVDWPSRGLRAGTLIDTPGIDSLSTSVSARTTSFLTPTDEPSAADAIVYLMRHLHASDVRFLESFYDQAAGRATMINAIGVLSRADEVGVGRIDALLSAQKVARRYSDDPMMRQLCQTVVPVAGLLAQTGRTLRQAEFVALQDLAACPRSETSALLLSADRFVRPDAPVPVAAHDRAVLLERFGLFGVRLSIALIRGGVQDASALAADLVRRSGLDEVRRVLAVQFTQRSDVLKARSALLAVDRVLREEPRAGTEAIVNAVERILAGAHEFQELRLLAALRAPGLTLTRDVRLEAERLLGGRGTGVDARLDLPAAPAPDEIRAAALDALRRWRERAENPLSDRATTAICAVVIRSCEGILAGVDR